MLFKVLQEHLDTFLIEANAANRGAGGVPVCVEKELRTIFPAVSWPGLRRFTCSDCSFEHRLELAGKRGKIVMQVGIRGFFAGPEAVLIDPIALTDPFLARLPAAPSKDGVWKAGRIKHALPQGYRKSVKAGNNQLTDPKLARLYSEIS